MRLLVLAALPAFMWWQALGSLPRGKLKPIAVVMEVNEPVVLLCTCTAIHCLSCNYCRCFLGDGGVREIRP